MQRLGLREVVAGGGTSGVVTICSYAVKIVVIPPSHILSEGGDKGVVGRRMKETPIQLTFRVREGCGGGIGVCWRCLVLNKIDK